MPDDVSEFDRPTLEVEVWQEGEPACCAHCGDDIDPGEELAWEPEPLYGKSAIVPVHTHCAVADGYPLDWGRVR